MAQRLAPEGLATANIILFLAEEYSWCADSIDWRMTAFFGALACVSVLKHLGLSHTHLRLQNEIIEHEKSAPVKQWFCQRAAMIPSCATAVWRCSRVRQHGREEHGNDRMDIGTRKMESWRKRKTRPVNGYDLISRCTAGCHAECSIPIGEHLMAFPSKKESRKNASSTHPKISYVLPSTLIERSFSMQELLNTHTHTCDLH